MSAVVVDTSAMVAILADEAGRPWLAAQLVGDDFARTDLQVLRAPVP